MDWQTVRELYPYRWVVVEALEAYTKASMRVIPRMQVVGDFADNWRPAWQCYATLHHAYPTREYYVIHTGREEMDIEVRERYGSIEAVDEQDRL
jgi:hypothetical protein